MRNSPLSMPPGTRLQQSGVGLVDVLIALLLLSISLLSSGAATLRAMQAGRSATLQMRATDLAADLNEDLEAARDVDIQLRISDWKQRVLSTLPVAVATIRSSGDASMENPALSAHMRWMEPTAAELSMPLPQLRGEIDP